MRSERPDRKSPRGGLAGVSGGEVGPKRTASGAATLGNRGLSDLFSLLLIMYFLGKLQKYFLRRGGRPASCLARLVPADCQSAARGHARRRRGGRLPQDEAAASAGPAAAGASRLSRRRSLAPRADAQSH